MIPRASLEPALIHKACRVALLAVSVFTACGEREDQGILTRLAAPPDGQPFERLEMFDPVVERAWSFTEGDVSPWVVTVGELLPGRGISSGTARIRLPESLATQEVDALRLTLNPPLGGSVTVDWQIAGDGQPAGQTKVLVERGQRTVVVPLLEDPRWAQTARMLRVSLRTSSPDSTWTLLEMISLRSGERLTTDLDRDWLVGIGDDFRQAIPAPPGLETTRPVPLGTTTLDMALGVDGIPRQDVVFRVSARKPGGERLVSEFILTPEEAHRGWRIEAVPWPAGYETVVLTTVSDADWELARALPVWADLRAIGRRPRVSTPNLLLLSADTLRADRLSLYGYPLETTPHLAARAAASGIVFERTMAAASWTLPSHVSMFSGLSAVRHGINHRTTIPRSIDLLAERFFEAGYRTAAFTAGGFLSAEFGFARGFDSYRIVRDGQLLQNSRDELETGVARLEEWLETAADQPFMALLHTYEPHAPYWVRSPYFERFGGNPADLPQGYATTRRSGTDERIRFILPAADDGVADKAPAELISLLYDSSVAYLDEQLERVFGILERLSLLETTIIVLTSDHGESLGEHGLAGHGYPYEDNLMVPLVIWAPELSASRVPQLVRSIDIAPTVLDLTGLEELRNIDGRTLRPLIEGAGLPVPRAVLAHSGEWGIAFRYDDRYKYILRSLGSTALRGDELYDLGSDPLELRNLDRSEPRREEVHAALGDALRSAVQGVRIRITNPTRREFTVSFSSSANRPAGLHAVGCSEAQWSPSRTVEVKATAGRECELFLQHARPTALLVGVRGTSHALGITALDMAVEPGALTAGSRLWTDGSEWTEAVADALAIRLEWSGRLDDPETELVSSPQLLQQLRDLGYVE
jgi:arylsulfatase A-like enzyme